MYKQVAAAIRKWLSTLQTGMDSLSAQDDRPSSARRSFFKKAAVGAVSITTTAGLANTVVDSLPQPSLRDHYMKDSRAGEDELREHEYVVMSEQEKADMVQVLINHHTNQS